MACGVLAQSRRLKPTQDTLAMDARSHPTGVLLGSTRSTNYCFASQCHSTLENKEL